MQLEIRNAVERDQLVYNGLGLLFGAIIAVIFFRRVSLMLLAALPPVLAVLWSLGMLGWIGFKLNLFLNVMTPLIMVMGFADSMQMVSAIRIRLREGDTRLQAVRFAVRVVGPACVLAHGTALLSFVRAAVLAVGADPHVRHGRRAGGVHLLRGRHPGAAAAGRRASSATRPSWREDRSPADGLMDGLGGSSAGSSTAWCTGPTSIRSSASSLFFLFGAAYRHLRAALPPRRPGARPRAGAGRHRPHRPEADRRQPGARHDRVEDGAPLYSPGPWR